MVYPVYDGRESTTYFNPQEGRVQKLKRPPESRASHTASIVPERRAATAVFNVAASRGPNIQPTTNEEVVSKRDMLCSRTPQSAAVIFAHDAPHETA